MNDTPRDADGAKLCAWCGEVIRQSGIGRSKDYCRRSCRQRAYERRQVEQQLAAHRRLWDHMASDSSRDESRSPDDPSRDETMTPGPAPAQPAPPSPTPPPPPRPNRRRTGMQASAMPLPFELGDADDEEPDA